MEKAEETCLGSWYRVAVGSVQSLMREKRLNKFSPDYFDNIIVDEAHHCCPAGTMIDGMPIEKIKVGDIVSAYNHESGNIVQRRVTAKMKNSAPSLYEIFLSDGSRLCCTGKHPVWNGAEYVPAESLCKNDELWRIPDEQRISKVYKTKGLFYLWENLFTHFVEFKNDTFMLRRMQTNSARKQEEKSNRNLLSMRKGVRDSGEKTVSGEHGKDVLLGRMQQDIPIKSKFGHDVGNKQKVCLGEDDRKQSYEKRGIALENAKLLKRSPICQSHGKRTIHKTSNNVIQRITRKLRRFFCVGVPNKDIRSKHERPYSKLLQSRHCLPGFYADDRSGWQEPLNITRETSGCVENGSIESTRVVGIKIHKPSSGGIFGQLCPDGYVYNIEVEKDNNYFADGILVHNCLSDSYQRVLNYFDSAKVLGVTATPDRGDMRNLGQYFQSLAYEYTLPQAIREGFLCPIKAQTIPLKLDLTGVGQQAGDFKTSDLGTALDPYLYQIADEMQKYCMDRKTVVFLPLIKTSQKFCEILRSRGFEAAEVNGESGDRAQILKDFDAGRYNVLCNSMLLTEGWDCPSVDCIVVLRPTKIRSLYSQMVGRGTRLHPGKDHLLLLDFLWHTERHELCHPAHLICENPEVAEKMTENIEAAGCPMDLEQAERQAAEDVVAQREEALAKQLHEMRSRKKKLVDPLQFEMSIQAEDLSGYLPSFGWEMGPPSEKQVQRLEKAGIFPDEIECAGKAAKLIDRLDKRYSEGLTTPKQIRLLEQKGFQHVGTWQKDQASKLIDRIAANNWRVPYGMNPSEYMPEPVAVQEDAWTI